MVCSLGQSCRPFGAITAWLAVAALTACGNSGADGGESPNAAISTSGSTSAGVTGGGSSGVSGSSSVAGSSGSAGSGGGGVAGTSGSVGASGSGGTGGMGGGGDTSGAGGSVGASGSGGTGGMGGGVDMSGTGGSAMAGGSMEAGGMGGGGDAGGAGESAGMGGSAGQGGSMGSGGSAAAGGEPSTCPPATPLTGGTEYCSNSKGNAGGGYAYELWAEGSGSGCMTVYGVDANFGATWDNVDDFLARVGLDFDQTRTHTQVGTIKAEFQETRSDEGGLTYIGIYGWTVNPLHEFYILDDWGSEKPGGTASDGTPRDEVGTLTADGETYDVWKKTRENKPSIQGDATFDQYFSIRRTARQCGTISVSEHFTQWEALGLPLGNLYEVKLLVEAQDNSGTVEFTTATVVVE